MRIAVFCGSKSGEPAAYTQAAEAVGRAIAARGWGLVYGGGHVGLMGSVADAALAGGAEVIGVIPELLLTWEQAQDNITRLEVVRTMHQRKARMAELADGFLILPGGFGTLDETFEIVTWAQLELHAKPVVLLDVAHFYTGLIAWLNGVRDSGLLRAEHRNLLQATDSIEQALAWMTGANADKPNPPRDLS